MQRRSRALPRRRRERLHREAARRRQAAVAGAGMDPQVTTARPRRRARPRCSTRSTARITTTSAATRRRRCCAGCAPRCVHFRCADARRACKTRVLREPALFTELLRFLTVQVSDMFRDPIYFRALREHVVPYLQTYPSLKIWVAGCATGEEAYSLAILLARGGPARAHADLRDRHQPRSLRVAQDGVYETERLARFSRELPARRRHGSLSDYYSAAYGGAVFDRALRRSRSCSPITASRPTARSPRCSSCRAATC